ncbi:(2Fe-2S)-binding protein [Microtetraspora sp. NBRC 13810]|uniref:Rieske (2Fe-2S) protein n=1 Tax=Microtetraspora sp. NBRC 13810 TaxID=3030990 RepID=UPI0024A2257F|nr:non-heme iron oxygenase ferredoxin subunit [Microtetraspora sp. NBRC 13810]GLW08316.1 (2Fe-2S)-binding protein [Microtetraspora sp. NBRC 13810]
MSEAEVTFEKVCKVSDIPEGGVIGVEVGDTQVALVRSGDGVHALYDVCSHAEVKLSEGDVYDGTLECWLHGSCFDVRTGKPTGPPATKPVPVYQVKIDGDDVYVSLSKES